MAGVNESVKTVNSLLRTVIGGALIGGVGLGSYIAYDSYTADDRELEAKNEQLAKAQADLATFRQEVDRQKAQIGTLQTTVDDQKAEIAEQLEEINRLDTAMRLLKVDHRVAEIRALDIETDEQSGEKRSVIEFVEVNDEGAPIDEPKRFELRGDVVYVDTWVAKFRDEFVEQADLDRSTTICLFRRIFGEFQEPSEGYPLDRVGTRPTAYGRGGQMSDFESNIWDQFWELANNPDRAEEMGVRALHGEAPSIKLKEGKSYRLKLRSSGGLTIDPGEDLPSTSPAA